MKKKIISLLTAAMLVASMGTTVFAAGSPSAGDISKVDQNPSQTVKIDKVEVKDSADYAKNTEATATVKNAAGEEVTATVEVKAVSNDTVNTTAKEVETQLKNVEALATDVANADTVKAAAKDATKKIIPEIKTVVNIEAEGVEVTEQNPITLTISADVKAGDSIVILHWNGTEWETIMPSEVRDGAIVATFNSLSPIAVVKLTVAETDTNGGNDANGGNNGANGGNGSNGSNAANGSNTVDGSAAATKTNAAANKTTTTKTSPKTGWSLL